MTDTTGMVKVGLYGPDGEFETMWATPMGEHRYRLENLPFYAYSVSWLDIVEARPESDEPSAFPVFERVVEKSGHRTLRLILVPGIDEDPARKRILEDLEALGCTYEGYNPRYFVLDIAPEHDLAGVVDYLTGNALDWEYVDPRYEDLFPDEP